MSSEAAGAERWWFRVQNALTLAALVVAPMFEGRGRPAALVAGAGLFALGAIAGVLGVRDLGSNRTPHPAPRPEGQLVTTGIYGRIRHPLYASLIMVCLGWSAMWFSFPAAMLTLALAVFLDRKARHEEQWLRRRFPGYADYMARVRRFVPGIY
jgi:protein-S-isoprenylcysteine O-methyltransferase Ste14